MWGELSSECGASCLGASFLWGELSWGELSLGRVVLIPLKTRVFLTLIIRLPVYNSKFKLTFVIINDTIITFLTT